jgi:chitinase
MFGPVQSGNSTPRPFGTAIIDGFDIDLEDPVENNMEPFVAELKNLMDASASKKFYLSAAPQCVYPDKADESFLNGQVPFDWVNVQFYNNGCGVSHYPSDFNWATWDNWAKTVSANKNAKVLIGTPANVGGANVDSFPTDLQLSGAILLAKRSSSFGGVMLWDMAQLFANAGYLAKVVADLGSSSSSLTHPPVAFAALQTVIRPSATIMSPTSPPVSDGSVPQWGQCGGIGYSGPTQCQSPFICITTSEWWSQCK